MTANDTLANPFSHPVVDHATSEQCATVARHIASAVEIGRATWPDIDQSPEVFASYLRGRLETDERDPLDVLARLHVADLYLVCACEVQVPAAIRRFTDTFEPLARAAVERLGLPTDQAEEVVQSLFETLLVPRSDRRPGISGYAGRGQLRSWVRSAAIRTALKHLRSLGRSPRTCPDLEVTAPQSDIELWFMKEAYRGGFEEALRRAIDALTPRQRMLLRQQFISGLSLDQLAVLYQVHRSTAARWVAAAREALFEATRAELCSMLVVSPEEFESIARLVQSQVDVSIDRLLADPAPDPVAP